LVACSSLFYGLGQRRRRRRGGGPGGGAQRKAKRKPAGSSKSIFRFVWNFEINQVNFTIQKVQNIKFMSFLLFAQKSDAYFSTYIG